MNDSFRRKTTLFHWKSKCLSDVHNQEKWIFESVFECSEFFVKFVFVQTSELQIKTAGSKSNQNTIYGYWFVWNYLLWANRIVIALWAANYYNFVVSEINQFSRTNCTFEGFTTAIYRRWNVLSLSISILYHQMSESIAVSTIHNSDWTNK